MRRDPGREAGRGKRVHPNLRKYRLARVACQLREFRDGPRSPFGALVTLFYGPLFAVIGALNAALAKLPCIPAAASSALGAVLWVPQALHIAALGALCVPLKLALRL